MYKTHFQALLVLIGCFWGIQGFAISSVRLKIDNIQSSNWKAEQAILTVLLTTEKKLVINAQLQQFQSSTLKQPVKELSIVCPQLLYSIQQITCTKTSLTIPHFLETPTNLSIAYLPNPLKVDIAITQAIGTGSMAGQLLYQKENWQGNINIKILNLEDLSKRLQQWIELPLGLSFMGVANLTAQIAGIGTQIQNATLKTTLNAFGLTNATGSTAGEKLNLEWTVTAKPSQAKQQNESGLEIATTLKAKTGELYIQPLYLSFQKEPLSIEGDMLWFPSRLILKQVQYKHENIGTVIATGDINLKETIHINALSARLPTVALMPIYSAYIQPSFEGSSLSQLEVDGYLSLNLLISKDKFKIIGGLNNVSIDDTNKKFGISHLLGTFEWDSQQADKPTNVKWDSAYVLSHIQLGAAQLYANLGNEKIQLLAPLNLPILDGAFRIDNFNLVGGFGEKMNWELKGKLQPISMQALTTALQLTTLNGYLGGEIPSIRYQNGIITIGGALQFNIFDGKIIAQRLTLESLFGAAPVLKADIVVDKIDLKTLTDITKFGSIQGLLSGYVRNLYLVNWQPVTFDAYLGTPDGQTMTRKISQKAVNNLSNLGGGGAIDALSRGVLSMFENFSYEKLGLGCRLQNGICTMWGAETASNGYYIVKGGGLPRIDVLGYNERVNWVVLLSRLAAITQASNPVIK
ncbi:hypothetical protein BegalDRAFT_3156 [Beggiatoa alba B18LD]|uniref:Dicarboxylate transport n=1 Tax=Beggiatoa alba B18LD TaxID=395493 RepID=I3CK38_9GAMM|nr:hypothetical protein [Beggiatoa alba]EIJ43981.1 hypothetical protein BegalDRAFT_3156 [Beggiatoa alba B18LD]